MSETIFDFKYKMSETIFDFKYKTANHSLTLNDLNNSYGDYGKTFYNKKEAEKFLKSIDNKGYLTRLIDYNSRDVTIGGRIAEGAKPKCIGWLVTITKEPKTIKKPAAKLPIYT
jgi:hypothetical protein